MVRLKLLPLALAAGLLTCGLAGSVSAQPRMDPDRDWERRDWRDRDGDRDWGRGPRWREPDCYYERRRERNRFGEIVIRRYRVCED
ncbi:hypothetical protein [Microvirga sp. G4-2]|uniref:hypothetical protein n=1 Tax=Microvirga sp. G4-2 TaxID=3434467 RepID=UPI004043CF13